MVAVMKKILNKRGKKYKINIDTQIIKNSHIMKAKESFLKRKKRKQRNFI